MMRDNDEFDHGDFWEWIRWTMSRAVRLVL